MCGTSDMEHAETGNACVERKRPVEGSVGAGEVG